MEPGTRPLVSVVIPLYNHEAYVREALDSVLASSVEHLEVIVVDDGSTDRSVDIVHSVRDGRIRLIRQENRGAHAAINRGVEAAAAPWVAILNSDDRFHPHNLQRRLELHALEPALEASACRVRYISVSGAPLPEGSWRVWRYRKMTAAASGTGRLLSSLIAGNHLVTTSSLFVKRSVLTEIGGFPPLRYVHDWFVFLALAARDRFAVIEEELADYRRHPTNTIAENDALGRVEDNFVLEWHLAQAFAARPPLMDVGDALAALNSNSRVSYRLLLLFRLWRAHNDNDLGRAAEVFLARDHPLVQQALEIVAAEKRGVGPERLVRRLLGRRSVVAADWIAKGLRYVEMLSSGARSRKS